MAGVFTLAQLAERLGATLRGNPAERSIGGLATLQDAQAQHLSFLANPQYRKFLSQTQCRRLVADPCGCRGLCR